MELTDKVVKMIQSGDPEMAALAISTIIQNINCKEDYHIVQQFIKDKVPSWIGSSGKMGGNFRKQTSVRKRLRIGAQERYMEVVLRRKDLKTKYKKNERN